MSLRSTANFCRRFGIGFKAGVDFLRLIDSEAKHGTARQRAIMSDVHQSVRTGSQLHVAMMEHANYFPALLIAMTRAGEITGTLDRTLLALANYYDERIRLYREFISRITWPMLQLFIAVNILALLIWLMGNLTPAGGGEMMDILGFGLRGSSGALTLYGYVICFGLIVAAMIVGFQKNIAGVQNLIPILYKVPVIGEALQTITLARYCWTLALALDAGIDPIRAMHMACDATDSDYYRSAKDDIERSIHNGNNISGSMQVAGVFPDEFINEVSVAEMSGTDAEAMHHLAAQYDTRARSAMQTLARVASGIIALSVACALIFVILRMIMNIYGPGGAYSEALKPI